ncbi:helix-turn-helix transcriptional regulator [Pigmentiphaga litoralis]|uniref:helix-turn-helix transcriptional regulator n=1 Tax=Pigmentiphaga litoralis TaxID=516702 RepID=UPI0015C7CC67|nr:AlpA family phage regulatory protein [Pigmentiphaga litoralis]
MPGLDAYDQLPQFPKRSVLPFRRTIRRQELRQTVPLAETTIYEIERRGEFSRRFNLTPRCVVRDLVEVEARIEERKQTPRRGTLKPDVHLRKARPVRASCMKSEAIPLVGRYTFDDYSIQFIANRWIVTPR